MSADEPDVPSNKIDPTAFKHKIQALYSEHGAATQFFSQIRQVTDLVSNCIYEKRNLRTDLLRGDFVSKLKDPANPELVKEFLTGHLAVNAEAAHAPIGKLQMSLALLEEPRHTERMQRSMLQILAGEKNGASQAASTAEQYYNEHALEEGAGNETPNQGVSRAIAFLEAWSAEKKDQLPANLIEAIAKLRPCWEAAEKALDEISREYGVLESPDNTRTP